jgi:hypothetical protein
MAIRNNIRIVALIAAAMLMIATACTDDSDRDPDAPAGTGAGTPSADFGTPSPEPGEEEEEGGDEVQGTSATVETEVTVPPSDTDDGTPGTSNLPSPQSTGTPVQVAERTVTPDSEAVGPQGQAIFPDIRSNVPDLENFTLTITGEIDITEQQDDSATQVNLDYSRSAPDTFYLFFEGDTQEDDIPLETWQIGDQFWIREEGEINEASEGIADGFDISSYLSMLPDVSRISDAEHIGEEEVEGRTVQHYEIPADEAVGVLPGMEDADVSDAEGAIEVWVAEDEQIILRMVVDLQWTGANDEENSMDLEYQVTDIGETEDIQPPQE